MANHHARWVFRFVSMSLVPVAVAACGTSSDAGAPPNGGENAGRPSADGASPGAATDPGSVGPGTGDDGSPTPSGVGSGDVGSGDVAPGGELSGADGASLGPSGGGEGSGDESADSDEQPPAPACPATATLGPGDTTKTITVDGVERSFLVHAPPSYDGTTPLPVVLDFHGLGGNSNQQKNLSRWDDVGDAEGFITVYPQGIDNAWNAGLCCGNGNANDDVAFVRALLTTLASDACIDSRRVFASGCSNGGGMSYKLACEAADVIAAIAPVDFDCVDGAGCGNCEPERPISVVQFRGTNDQLVSYEGNGFFLGAQANFATWGEINSCSGAAAPLEQSNGCESLPMCGDGAQTVLCTVQGGTHCGSYGSFSIAEVAWRLLRNEARP